MPIQTKARRFFTEAARAAALKARAERAASPIDPRTPKVFAVRLAWPSNRFGWEIRQFGGIVLAKSVVDCETLAEAREAGDLALAALSQPDGDVSRP